MRSERRNRRRWRLALFLLVGAYVGVIAYLVLPNESSDDALPAKLRVSQAHSATSGSQAPAGVTVGAAAPVFKINAAVQKPGPPNPEADRSAADAAEKAADAAAAIAASVPTSN
jgi:hypothetical protein